MQIRIHKVSILMMTFLMTLSLSFPISANTKMGWTIRDGKWYYYTKNGTLARDQWLKIGNKLFRLDEDGSMICDAWLERDRCWYYLSAAGAAATGWQEIKGKWYYFDKETCIMATNATIDNWYVGADGAWEPSD